MKNYKNNNRITNKNMKTKITYPIIITIINILLMSIMLLCKSQNDLIGIVFTGFLIMICILFPIFMELLKINNK
ncbi:MAG: hypothetical protein QM532_04150 [Cyanobium sp. MAG06]|nr:hypothetical protein [Cyanobium sp. MAG06]